MADLDRAPRVLALDGLRGVAAVIVVLHHLLLTQPATAAMYFPDYSDPRAGSAAWIVSHTPLQLLVSGQEAVLVFFVLSGIALVVPARAPGFDWFGYYPGRLVRLLLPVAAAVILALVIVLITPQTPGEAASAWVASSMRTFDPRLISGVEVLLGDTGVDNPLWSLRHEVLFSLLLPLFVLVARMPRRRLWILAAAAIPVMALGEWAGDPVLVYLPVFLLGAGIAAVPALLTEPARARPVLPWIGGLLIALAAVEARWILADLGHRSPTAASGAQIVEALGAAGLVVVVLGFAPARRLFQTRVARGLGRISFSLYLVHVPVIIGTVAIVRVVAPAAPWFVGPAVAIVPIVVLTALFAGWIEMPAHRLARRISRRLGARQAAS